MRVYEYFIKTIDSKDYIVGWQSWSPERRPDLIPNPTPSKQMNDHLKDEYGNPIYRLEGIRIIEDPIAPTPVQITDHQHRTESLDDKIRRIVQEELAKWAK